MSKYGHEASSGLAVNLAALALVFGGSALAGEYVESRYNSSDAAQFLEQSGYKNPRLTDTDTFLVGLAGCDQLDAVKHEFKATAPNGTPINVMVCNGIFKGATIRQAGV